MAGENTRKFELDEYEKWIEKEIEKGHFVSVENFEEWKKTLEKTARKTLEEIEKKERGTQSPSKG